MTDVIDNAGGHRQVRYHDEADGTFSESEASHLRAWDATTGAWVRVTVDHATGALQTTSSGGAGGAATIADGADVAQGATTDTSSASTVVGVLKAIKASLAGSLTTTTSWASPQHVIVDTAPSTAVTGPLTDTQLRASAVPISLATLPSLAAGSAVIGHVIVDTAPTTAVTAASLPLPTGAATDATLTAAIGSATDTPSAYTVLDQLTKLRKAAEAELKAVQQLIALQTPVVARKSQPTLLHRS